MIALTEEVGPIEEVSSTEEIAPIEEVAPTEEIAPIEEVARTEEIAPTEEIASTEEVTPTGVARSGFRRSGKATTQGKVLMRRPLQQLESSSEATPDGGEPLDEVEDASDGGVEADAEPRKPGGSRPVDAA